MRTQVSTTVSVFVPSHCYPLLVYHAHPGPSALGREKQTHGLSDLVLLLV